MLSYFKSKEILAATETDAYVQIRELDSAVALNFLEEVPEPGEQEHCVRDDNNAEEEPLPSFGELV